MRCFASSFYICSLFIKCNTFWQDLRQRCRKESGAILCNPEFFIALLSPGKAMVQVRLRQWNVAIASKPQTPCFSHFLAPSSEWYYSVTSHCKAPSRCPLWHLQPYRLSELWKAQAEPVLCLGERNAEWDTDLGEALKTSGHLGGGRGEEWKLDLIFMGKFQEYASKFGLSLSRVMYS